MYTRTGNFVDRVDLGDRVVVVEDFEAVAGLGVEVVDVDVEGLGITGVYTLRNRQSSAPITPFVLRSNCTQAEPNLVPSRIPSHFSGGPAS